MVQMEIYGVHVPESVCCLFIIIIIISYSNKESQIVQVNSLGRRCGVRPAMIPQGEVAFLTGEVPSSCLWVTWSEIEGSKSIFLWGPLSLLQPLRGCLRPAASGGWAGNSEGLPL